jgi:DnaK suppressor protein
MRRHQRPAYRKLLAAKEADLLQELRHRDGIVVRTASADVQEHVQGLAERELAVWNLNHASIVLRLVREAQQRLEKGAFGTCAGCGQDIGLRRLAAVPWTSLCRECQETEERETGCYARAA